jgi:nitrogen regulatory protein P-II 1
MIEIGEKRKGKIVVKRIEAVVTPHELENIRANFLEAGISNMMVSAVREYGSDFKHTEIYRSEEYLIDSTSKIKIETIIPQNLVTRAIEIISGNRQSENGERRPILVSTVVDVNR